MPLHQSSGMSSFGIFRISNHRNVIAIKNVSRSVIGWANLMPSRPKKCGRISSNGIRKTICFEKESRAPFVAFPIAGKNVAQQICMPFKKTQNRKARMKRTPYSTYIGSSPPSPNREMSGSVKISNTSQSVVEMMTAAVMKSFTVWRTRPYFFAP